MTITTAQAISTLENVLFESATIATANAVSLNLSSYSSVDALAQSLTALPEFAIAGQIVRYYQAALGRGPSGFEIGYYVTIAEHGLTAAQIAQGAGAVPQAMWNIIATDFAASSEFAQDFGLAAANSVAPAKYTSFVTSLYQNVLARTPSATELGYYVAQLAAGDSPAVLVQEFSNSPEYQNNVTSSIQSQLVTYNDALLAGGSNMVSISTPPVTTTHATAHGSQGTDATHLLTLVGIDGAAAIQN